MAGSETIQAVLTCMQQGDMDAQQGDGIQQMQIGLQAAGMNTQVRGIMTRKQPQCRPDLAEIEPQFSAVEDETSPAIPRNKGKRVEQAGDPAAGYLRETRTAGPIGLRRSASDERERRNEACTAAPLTKMSVRICRIALSISFEGLKGYSQRYDGIQDA